jgi:hypothetical protein
MNTDNWKDDLDAASKAYRAAPQDEPPAALDDAIRAAARRAVQAGPRPAGTPFMRRWQLPLAAAASVTLAVSVLFVTLDEHPDKVVVPEAIVSVPGPAEKTMPADTRAIPSSPTSPSSSSAPATSPSPSVAGTALPADSPPPPATPAANHAVTNPIAAPTLKEEAPIAQLGVLAEQTAQRQRRDALESADIKRAESAARTLAPAAPPPAMAAPSRESDQPEPRAVPTVSTKAAVAAAPAARLSAAEFASSAPTANVVAAPAPGAGSGASPAPLANPAGKIVSIEDVRQANVDRVLKKSAEKSIDESVEAWILRMQALRAAGKEKELRTELARFRKLHPDVALPKELAAISTAPDAP